MYFDLIIFRTYDIRSKIPIGFGVGGIRTQVPRGQET